MAGRFVKKDSLLLCPECKKTDYAIVWDENTRDTCISRELRRNYTSLIGKRGIQRESKLHYKCPKCSKFVHGWKLKIIKNIDE